MSKSCKVNVQKGEINPAQKTLKTMSHRERESDRMSELRELKDRQTLKFNQPKK